MPKHLLITEEAIQQFCRRHHITEMRLFGSVLRDEILPRSEVIYHAAA